MPPFFRASRCPILRLARSQTDVLIQQHRRLAGVEVAACLVSRVRQNNASVVLFVPGRRSGACADGRALPGWL
jgi:hypothetical protein